MSNMSYCRFQNTLIDLRVCRRALTEIFNHASDPLSTDELEAAGDLAGEAATIVEALVEQMVNDLTADETTTVLAILARVRDEAADRIGEANAECTNEDGEDEEQPT